MRGGKCYFALGSKSSNILVEVFEENERKNLIEMRRCVLMDHVWEKKSLYCLLDSVEACCRGEDENCATKHGWKTRQGLS